MIGVFDSGIGGLSILRALRAELPAERFSYLADSAHAPYGERDDAHVAERSRVLARQLVDEGAEALVVACNTATAAAIHLLRAEFAGLPIVGVEPALKPAVARSPGGRIGVMATRSTLGSHKFAQLIASLQGEAEFFLQPCDGLASAIERSVDGSANSARELAEVCARHVQALQAAAGPLATVVLGCTHYPLAAPLLAELLGPGPVLLEPGPAVARHTRTRLAALPGRTRPSGPALLLRSTGDAELLERAARRWIDPQAQALTLA